MHIPSHLFIYEIAEKILQQQFEGNCYVSSGQTKTEVIRMSVVQHYEYRTNFQITCIWWKIERCFLILFNRNVIKSNCKGQVTGWNLVFRLQYLQFRRASVSVWVKRPPVSSQWRKASTNTTVLVWFRHKSWYLNRNNPVPTSSVRTY